jgi:hypothetical protein
LRTLLAAAATAAVVVPAIQGAAATPAQAQLVTPTAAPTDPPPVTVLTQGADNGNGDIFISPFGDSSTYANGPEILDSHGRVVWFHAVRPGRRPLTSAPRPTTASPS